MSVLDGEFKEICDSLGNGKGKTWLKVVVESNSEKVIKGISNGRGPLEWSLVATFHQVVGFWLGFETPAFSPVTDLTVGFESVNFCFIPRKLIVVADQLSKWTFPLKRSGFCTFGEAPPPMVVKLTIVLVKYEVIQPTTKKKKKGTDMVCLDRC